MRVREAINYGIGIIIAGTTIPAIQTRIGAELNYAKRSYSARIGMPMAAGANKRVNKLGVILLFLGG